MKQFTVVFTLVILLSIQFGYAQKAVVKGTVTDEFNEPLIQANVIIDVSKGLAATTDFDGKYELKLDPGSYKMVFKYIGKEEKSMDLTVAAGDTKTIDMALSEKVEVINTVVVSASKYAKKLGEETVSIEVLKGDLLESNNITNLEEGMTKVPGVTVVEGQANIRGGAGWSYGAGSRVLMLVDDIPFLAADAGDVKWTVVPTENIEQVEVIKGAASALYGSSALNGIINARTAWPTSKPYTSVTMNAGIYGKPRNKDLAWWTARDTVSTIRGIEYQKDPPMFAGLNFAHRRKIKQFDLVVGGGYEGDKSYLIGGSNQYGRMSFKTRYRPKNVKGLSFGVNGNLYRSWGSTFFLWDGTDTLGYLPLPNTTSNYITNRFSLDPYVTYFDDKNNRYSFKGRWFNAKNTNDTKQGSVPNWYYVEGQYQRMFERIALNFVSGVSGYYSNVKSPTGDASESLIGNHEGTNVSVYAQLDKKFFDKLNVSFGTRYEYFRIDTFTSDAIPVFRAGVNYQAAEATYIRASWGQGYRFPSMAEKFINTNLGQIGIYPNPGLEPEKGWSAEFAVKQGFKFGEWMGFVDVAAFINEYENMMEFNFGRFGANTSPENFFGLGFASQNVGDTRIVGGEFTLIAQGKIKETPINMIFGYTYTDPKSLNWDDPIRLVNEDGEEVTATPETFRDGELTYGGSSSSDQNILKYRNKHTLKADLEVKVKRFDLGVNVTYTSFMENIDYFFVSDFIINFQGFLNTADAFSGLKRYREENQGRGNTNIDLRLGYRITDEAKVSFIVKNLLNQENTVRPALYSAPINYAVQFAYKIKDK